MYESVKRAEGEPEPLLSELMIELDHADLNVLKRYGWFINIPTEHNFSRVLAETGHLYHSFGQYLRKMIHGDVDQDSHKVSMTATVIIDGEESVLILLSRELKEKRIDMGRHAIDSAKDVLKVGAGTVLGMAVWNRVNKKN